MGITDCNGLPIVLCIDSASPHDITLVDKALDHRFISTVPTKMIGDKAYDSDPHDKSLFKRYSVGLIAPHRKGRKKPKTQDGRKLRHYKRRWKVDRLFSWLQNYRRVLARYEYKASNYLAFLQLAFIKIFLKQF